MKRRKSKRERKSEGTLIVQEHRPSMNKLTDAERQQLMKAGYELQRPKASSKKDTTYPEFTDADKVAAEIRRRANKLTAEQRAEYLRRGMVRVYGGHWPKETTGARH